MRNSVRITAAAVVLLLAAACGGGASSSTEGGTQTAAAGGNGGSGALTGTLALAAGECSDTGVEAGSYFRMVQPDGTVADGPFVENGDSSCGDKSFTPLAPGSAGLILGENQPFGEPAFDDQGNAAVDAIVAPTTFFAVAFGVGTPQTEPQTGAGVPAPTLEHDGQGNVTGDLSAWSVAYNGQYFAQGSPKPDGSMPGETSELRGTYDPETGAVTLDWSSQIVGGAFNNFTGIWHLEGTLE